MHLQVLFVEDSEDDVSLIIRELKRLGYEVEARRVETSNAMQAALKEKEPDVIICDYSLPSFNAPQALETLKSSGKDLPFIILSGTIGEETAVSTLKAGAHDFLLKGNLTRLGPVIERELREAATRREHRKAQDALAASESQLRALFASMQDVVFVIDRDGIYQQIAPTHPELLYVSESELLGKSLPEVMPHDKANEFMRAIAQVLKEQETIRIEYSLTINDQLIWFDASISPMSKDNTLWVVRDITKRKQAEEEIANSEKRFRALIENGVDYISLLASDGTLLWESPSATRMLGYEMNEFQGRNILDIVHPDDLTWVQERFGKLAATPGAQDRDSFRLKHRDGSWRWVDAVVTNLLNEPSVQAIVINYHDVTDREQAEEKIRKSERILREAEVLGHTGSWEQNLITGEIFNSEANLSLFFGDDRSKGASLDDYVQVVHPDDREYVKQRRAQLIEGGPPDIEYRVVWPDGSIHVIFGLATIIRDESGKAIRVNGTNVDITERKLAEEELTNSEERFRTLIEQSSDGIVLVDEQGIIAEWNQAQAAITGIPRSQAIGKYFGEIQFELLVPEHRTGRSADYFKKAMQDVFQTGQSPQFGKTIEVEVLSVSGERKFLTQSSFPIKGEHGYRMGSINRDVTERKKADNAIQQNLAELGMLYESGLALNQLLNPKEIAEKVIDLMSQKLDWHHVTIRLYHPENETLELLAHSLPINLKETEMRAIEERFRSLVGKIGVGLTGWAAKNRRIIRIGELSQDHRYLEIVPGLHSGLYIPMQTADRLVGTISIESEKPNAFSETDERLTITLANQAAIALENARLHEETVRQIQQLQSLHAIDLTISSSFDQRFTLDVLLNHAMKQLDADAASILLMRPSQQALKVVAEKGFKGRGLVQAELKLNNSFAGRTILERQMIHVNASELGTVQQNIAKVWSEEGFKSQHLMPLITKGEAKGVLGVFFRRDFTPNPAWNNFLETLAGQAAIAIDNTQMFDGLQRANMELAVAYDATIEGWSQAMDLRDKETEGHTQRVTKMAVELAKVMRINDEELVHIRRGALLHDIGKIGVPDHILLKPDKLTDEEWRVMKKHPQFAYEMLNSIVYLRHSLDIPYCHHEKWDGTGYPRGLKAEQIPLAARIFAVIDVWDAVTSDRPYRKAWSKEEALQYIRDQSGKHFDPQVVEVFLREFGNV